MYSRAMSGHDNRERTIFGWSAACAIAAVCAVFMASMSNANLLKSIIDTGVLFPIMGAVLFVRIAIGLAVFLSSERPPETRSFRAAFLRDKWLSDRLKLSQPRSVLVFGASLVFLKLAMLVALVVAALCVFLGVMSLGQGVSVFVVSTLLWIIYQAIGGSVLLLRQMNRLHADRQA